MERVIRVVIGILLTCILASSALAINGNMGGTAQNGSAELPYLIEDFTDFQAFAADSNYWAADVHTKLTTDIDLDPNLPGREIYTNAVIAWGNRGFMGVFNGNDHVVKNLKIDNKDADIICLGLFGYLYNGTIRNLGILQYRCCSRR